mgnify:CR=1 FL=1
MGRRNRYITTVTFTDNDGTENEVIVISPNKTEWEKMIVSQAAIYQTQKNDGLIQDFKLSAVVTKG